MTRARKQRIFKILIRDLFKENVLCQRLKVNSNQVAFNILKREFKLEDLTFAKYKNLVIKMLQQKFEQGIEVNDSIKTKNSNPNDQSEQDSHDPEL